MDMRSIHERDNPRKKKLKPSSHCHSFLPAAADCNQPPNLEKAAPVERIGRGRPTFAASQRDKILALLKQAGSEGVRREDLIFQHRWTQAGTRIFELEQMGYKIRHESRSGERLVVYVLESEPLELRPLPEGRDWYEA